jgi:hypothetical protein
MPRQPPLKNSRFHKTATFSFQGARVTIRFRTHKPRHRQFPAIRRRLARARCRIVQLHILLRSVAQYRRRRHGMNRCGHDKIHGVCLGTEACSLTAQGDLASDFMCLISEEWGRSLSDCEFLDSEGGRYAAHQVLPHSCDLCKRPSDRTVHRQCVLAARSEFFAAYFRSFATMGKPAAAHLPVYVMPGGLG